MRAVEAERAAKARQERAEQRRREEIQAIVARRTEENRAKIEAERQARAERQRNVDTACARATTDGMAADYRGELHRGVTRLLLAACALPSARDRWPQVEAILPEAQAEWQAIAKNEATAREAASRLEDERREREQDRRRQVELEEERQRREAEEDRRRQEAENELRLREEQARAAAEAAAQARRENTISAGSLISAYEANQIAADAEYKDRRIWVTGYFDDAGESNPIFGSPQLYVRLAPTRDDYSLWDVRCPMPDNPENRARVGALRPGDYLVVFGTVEGEGFLSVNLDPCQIVDT